MARVTISIEDDNDTVAGFAELTDYNLGGGTLRREVWVEITNIAPVDQPLRLAETRYRIDVQDDQISFVGCMAANNADPTRFLATDVLDFTWKSVLS
jgi:hypothetical protein